MKSTISKIMLIFLLAIFVVGCADTTSRVIDQESRQRETTTDTMAETAQDEEASSELTEYQRYVLLSADMTCKSFAAGGAVTLTDEEANAIANEYGFESWDEFLELDELYEQSSELAVIAKIRELCPQFFNN